MVKKIICALLVCVAFGATACPRGEHPHGGYGSHHRGGWCSYDNGNY